MNIPRALASPASSAKAHTETPDSSFRSWTGRVTGFFSAAIGTVAGITPHVLHHVGPVAGAALLSGTAGSFLFGVIGLVLTVPLLLQLRRRFSSWLAPAIALVVFATMFTISTLWIGPAVQDAISGDSDAGQDSHEEHHALSYPGLEDRRGQS